MWNSVSDEEQGADSTKVKGSVTGAHNPPVYRSKIALDKCLVNEENSELLPGYRATFQTSFAAGPCYSNSEFLKYAQRVIWLLQINTYNSNFKSFIGMIHFSMQNFKKCVAKVVKDQGW